MNQVSLKRLELINPVLAYNLGKLDTVLQAHGIYIEIVQGLRSWQQQQDLYNQGRTKPGSVVTNCKPGYSWHNFGMAVDVCPDKYLDVAGFQPNWVDSHPDWQMIHKCALDLGFVCGADFRTFPDKPHLQMTGRFPVTPTDEVRQLFKDGGTKAVWDESGLH